MRLGLDFGTCYSSGALLLDGVPTPVREPVLAQNSSFPSSLLVTRQGGVVVGHAAERQRRMYPERYSREFKRKLGSPVPVPLGERQMLPEEMVAEVLRAIKAEAETLAGRELTELVLTVPATYEAHKRQLMEDAARSAGFAGSVELLPEPVAAAIYFVEHSRAGRGLGEGETILVYDLGGGTFDATLVRKNGSGYEILGTPVGDPHCGGSDFDREILQDLKNHCTPEQLELLDLGRQDTTAVRARLMTQDFCREIKHHLSAPGMEEHEDWLQLGSTGLNYQLSRDSLNRMIRPYLEETIEDCRELLESAGLALSDIAGVLLVGGSCRIPYVQEMLAERLGRPIFHVEEPELAVVLGAASHAAAVAPPGPARGPQEAPDAAGIPPPQGGPAAAFVRYRTAVEMAWADEVLEEKERILLEKLRQELGLSDDEARQIEELVMAVPAENAAHSDHGSAPAEDAGADATLLVAPHGPVRSIAEAVRSARPGARIRVKPGLYREPIVLDRPLSIIAEEAEGEVVLECAEQPCLLVRSAGVTVTGLTIRGSSATAPAVSVVGGHLELAGCEIVSGAEAAVVVHGAPSRADLRRCRVHHAHGAGVCFGAGAGGTIEDCEIFGNRGEGVHIGEGSDPVIRRSAIHANQAGGVLVLAGGKGSLEECEIVDNGGAGVEIRGRGKPAIRRCRINRNRGAALFIGHGGRGSLTASDLRGNEAGIWIREGDGYVVNHGNLTDQRAAHLDGVDLPAINGRVLAIRLYEKGAEEFQSGEHSFRDRFPQRTTRYVCFQLDLEYPAPKRWVDLPLEAFWYGPDGGIESRLSFKTHVEATWTCSSHKRGYGWKTPGRWRRGEHRVEIIHEGRCIARKSFCIE